MNSNGDSESAIERDENVEDDEKASELPRQSGTPMGPEPAHSVPNEFIGHHRSASTLEMMTGHTVVATEKGPLDAVALDVLSGDMTRQTSDLGSALSATSDRKDPLSVSFNAETWRRSVLPMIPQTEFQRKSWDDTVRRELEGGLNQIPRQSQLYNDIAAFTAPLDKLDGLKSITVRHPLKSRRKNPLEVGYVAQSQIFVPIFEVQERRSHWIRRLFCGSARPLLYVAYGDFDTKQFILYRPFRMQCCCCSETTMCGRDYMEIITANGRVIGRVVTKRHCLCTCNWGHSLSVLDANGTEICELSDNTCCHWSCSGGMSFDVLIDGEPTGDRVHTERRGRLKDIYPEYSCVHINVPEEFEGNRYYMILLLAASLMVNLKYFPRYL